MTGFRGPRFADGAKKKPVGSTAGNGKKETRNGTSPQKLHALRNVPPGAVAEKGKKKPLSKDGQGGAK